jgi:RNA-directed DNA polymerase
MLRHSNRDRSRDRAGDSAAASAAVGPDIQGAQLWLPAEPLRSPSGGAGASLHLGSSWIIDLAKFFDRVNHHRLMAAVAARVTDRRLLRLIRGYLTAGVLDNGLFEDSREGTPQGGPLSPLLSSLVLDELDRELERRGHRFVRYADDCNICSEKASRRVMESCPASSNGASSFRHAEKSAVAGPWHRSFLGFTVRNEPEFRRCIANKAIVRFKHRVRELTGRHRGITPERMIRELALYLRG